MDLLELAFTKYVDLATVLTAGVSATAGAALAGLAVYKPTRSALSPMPRANELARHLPFETIQEDGKTLVSRDGTLSWMIQIDGLESFMHADDRRMTTFQAKQNMLDQLVANAPQVEFRSVSIRDETYEPPQPASYPTDAVARFLDIHDTRMAHGYNSRQIIIISARGSSAPTQLESAWQAIHSRMREQKPRLLSQHDADPRLWPASVLGRMINAIARPQPPGIGMKLSELLVSDRVAFHRKRPAIRFRNGDETIHARVMTIRTWGTVVDEYMTLQLSRLASESVIVQVAKPFKGGSGIPTLTALALKRDRSTMISTDRGSAKQAFNDVIADISGETDTPYTLWDHQTVITFYDRSEERLKRTVQLAQQICGDKFATLHQEGAPAMATWFSQFPGFVGPWPRQWLHSSTQLACALPFDSAPVGQRTCDWGDLPLLRLPTIGGSIFNLQLHSLPPKPGSPQLAHTKIIGMAGSGKSTIASAILYGALRFPNLRIFAFDYDRGLEIATFAAGGYQIRFDSDSLRLNPLDEPDSPDFRAWLESWITSITSTAEDDRDTLDEIRAFVVGAMTIPREHRTLRTAFGSDLVPDRKGGLLDRLRPWVAKDWRGDILNAPRNKIDSINARWITFDFTTLYEHPIVARAVIRYLTHKIEQTFKQAGVPGIIYIDEAHRVLLGDDSMTEWYRSIHRRFRKLSVAVISAFQDLAAIDECKVTGVLKTNVPMSIYFANRNMTVDECLREGMNDRETDFARDGWGLERGVLVKNTHPSNSYGAILNADLSHLRDAPEGDLLRLLAPDPDSRERLVTAVQAARSRGLKGEAMRTAALVDYIRREPNLTQIAKQRAA